MSAPHIPEQPQDPDAAPSSEAAELEALLAGLRAGSTEAWDTCLQRFGRLVYGIALGSGLDRETSEDVFQECWMTLHGQVSVVRNPAALPGWISTTAKRLSWRAARRDRARVQREEVARREQPEDGMLELGDLLSTAAEAEDREAVWSALDRISPRCRQLLVALHFESDSPSYADIAEQLGMPVGSVGPTRQRCLEKLARLLETRFA
jgi:RNA polymerase sigma factor (sigma-70 family)